jgi:anti-sigma factor RsiW
MADYLEGHLALADRALFDAHLDACSDCAREIAEMRATIAAMRSLPEPEVPGDFTAIVMRRVRAGDADPGWLGRLALIFEALGSPRVLVPVSSAVLSVGLVLWGQQLGVLSTMHPPDANRTALHARTEMSPSGVSSVRVASRSMASDAARFVDNSSAGLGDAARLSGDVSIGDSASHEDAPHPFSFQIVMSDGQGPPFVLERSGVGTVAPIPWRMDQPVPSGPQGFGSVDGRNGGSVAVSSAGFNSSGFDGGMPPRASALDPEPGVRSTPPSRELRSRDEWLAILEANPSDFAWRLSRLTLAERELWVDRLARHAQQHGELDRVISRLQSAGGPDGPLLADEFAGVGAEVSSATSSGGAR